MKRQAVEGRLKRRRGMSPEAAAALRAYNSKQEYRGQCRVCRATWSGLLSEAPKSCPNCGHGDADGA